MKGNRKNAFGPRETIGINIDLISTVDITDPVVGLMIQDQQGRVVFASNTEELGLKLGPINKGKATTATFSIDNIYTNDA